MSWLELAASSTWPAFWIGFLSAAVFFLALGICIGLLLARPKPVEIQWEDGR